MASGRGASTTESRFPNMEQRPSAKIKVQSNASSASSRVSHKRVRSRRLYYLERFLRSNHFTLDAIRDREPAYYQSEFLERFSAAQQRASHARERQREAQATSIVDQLLGGIDRAEREHAIRAAEALQRETEEEFETESEDEGEEDDEAAEKPSEETNTGDDPGQATGTASGTEDADNTDMMAPEDDVEAVAEFVRTAELRWLAGNEPGFDYEAVDFNEDNDDPQIVQQDAEDAYFAESDEEDTEGGDSRMIESSGLNEGEYDY